MPIHSDHPVGWYNSTLLSVRLIATALEENDKYLQAGKSSESAQCAVRKACDTCADMASYSALYQFGRLSKKHSHVCFLKLS